MPTLLPDGKFGYRADAENATAQKIALMGKLANTQKFINFEHWSGGYGINYNNSQIANIELAQFCIHLNPQALRAWR